MKVALEAKPNPDFQPNTHNGRISIKRYIREVSSLREASEVCQRFIKKNDLGGGNWTGGQVYDQGKQIAEISYNGRAWDTEGKEIKI